MASCDQDREEEYYSNRSSKYEDLYINFTAMRRGNVTTAVQG